MQDMPGVGWSWFHYGYAGQNYAVSAKGEGVNGSAAACDVIKPKGGMTFSCRWAADGGGVWGVGREGGFLRQPIRESCCLILLQLPCTDIITLTAMAALGLEQIPNHNLLFVIDTETTGNIC